MFIHEKHYFPKYILQKKPTVQLDSIHSISKLCIKIYRLDNILNVLAFPTIFISTHLSWIEA